MSNRIDTSNIISGQRLPLPKGRLDFIQNNTETLASTIALGLLGSYTTNNVIIWEGCSIVFPGSLPGTGSVTAGAIYYNGLFYQVDANASISIAAGKTLVWTLVSSYVDQGSPAQFTNGNFIPVEQQQKFVLVSGPSGGSGVTGYIADYNASTVIKLDQWNLDAVTTGITTTPTSTISTYVRMWKRLGNTVVFNFALSINCGSTTTGLSASIPMPIPSTFSLGMQNTGMIISPSAWTIASIASGSSFFTVNNPYLSVTSGTVYTLQGQITYPVS